MKLFNYIVFVGRFQLFHIAHLRIIKHALTISDNVIIVIGSAFKPRTPKNPWTVAERQSMISSAFTSSELDRIKFTWARDYMYNNSFWAKEVKRSVNSFINTSNSKIGIIGHKKDESSFYLDFFPEWGEPINVPGIEGIHATLFRKSYFEQGIMHEHHNKIPITTKSFLNKFFYKPEYLYVKEWYDEVKNIKSKWAGSPYEPMFITVDSVIFKSSHILMVKRKGQPGKGLYALPGGYKSAKETINESMMRELKEETKIKVAPAVLMGHLKEVKVFDHPDRSDRGCIVTHAHMIHLNPGPLDKVKGGDDAEKALWVPLDKIDSMSEEIFEDHLDIIKYFEGRLENEK